MKTVTRIVQTGVLAMMACAAQAESTQCQEVVPPATITQSGSYCLKKSYNTNLPGQPAISIEASDVTLDLNGFSLINQSTEVVKATSGVKAYNVTNVTVRNGGIRGYGYGVFYDAPDASVVRGQLVEDLFIDRTAYCGVCMVNQQGVIRRNIILRVEGDASGNHAGISGGRSSLDIMDNDIGNLASSATGSVSGIALSGSKGQSSIVEGNRITQFSSLSGYGSAGIWLYSDTPAIVRGNSLSSNNNAAEQSKTFGIRSYTDSAKIIGNVVSLPVGVSYSGGTLASGTNY
jgi:hypothetical protein